MLLKIKDFTKKIFKFIREKNNIFFKLIKKKIIPLIIIIAIFLTIKFNPKWLTDFLGITDAQGGVSDLISYIELMIEFGFLYFVLKEFKMTKEEFKMTRKEFEITRKNFEWQKKEQQEKADKEANRQLTEIVEFFAYQYECVVDVLINEYEHDKLFEKTRERFLKERFLKLIVQRYKEENKKVVDEQEISAINKINESFYELYRINARWCIDRHIRSHPETAKHIGIDYKILEKIYNNIVYKDYDDQKTN